MQPWNVARWSTADVGEQPCLAEEYPLLHDARFDQKKPWCQASDDHAFSTTVEMGDDSFHDIFGGLSDINRHHYPNLSLEKPPISSTFEPKSEIARKKSRTETSGSKGKHQELQQIQGESSEVIEQVCANKRRKTPSPSQTRKRSAQMHNEYEKKRRDRINEKMRTLRSLMPTCYSCYAASILDHAVEYLKALKHQIQIMGGTEMYQYPWVTQQWIGTVPIQPPIASPLLSMARPSPAHSSGFPAPSVLVPSSYLHPSPSPEGENVAIPQMQFPSVYSQPLLTALLLSANNGSSADSNSGNPTSPATLTKTTEFELHLPNG